MGGKSIIKSLSCLLLVASFLSAPVTVGAAESESENGGFVVNSDFDDGNTGIWNVFGGGNISIDTTDSHSGGASLTIDGRNGTYHGPSIIGDEIFMAGETYDFSAWVCNKGDVTSTISCTMKYTNNIGEAAYMQIKSEEAAPGEWVELLNTFTLPEGSYAYIMYFESTDPTASFNIDDVMISGEGFSERDTTESGDYSESYEFDFETGVEMWTPRGTVKVLSTDEYSNTGKNSIYVSDRTATWNGATVSTVDKIKKGEEYYYSAYVMYSGDEFEDSHIFRLETEYMVQGVTSYNLIADKEIEKGKWTKIEGYYTVPEGASNLFLYVQTDNVGEGEELTSDDLMPFYVDTVTITRADIVKKQKRNAIIFLVVMIVATVALLSFIAARIIAKIKKNKLAMKYVSIDAMTEVLNRNSYEKKIAELENDTEQCRELYYALCDVNFLKYLNDNYGHETGDAAITRCAKMLTEATGNSCKVYRTGGDEFVCISQVPIDENIRKAIKAEAADDKGYPFAVACGFATYDETECPDIKSIIARCDKEMYADKQRIKAENEQYSRK